MQLVVKFRFKGQLCTLQISSGSLGWVVSINHGQKLHQIYRGMPSCWAVCALALPSVLGQFLPEFTGVGGLICCLHSVGATDIVVSEFFDGLVVKSTCQQL